MVKMWIQSQASLEKCQKYKLTNYIIKWTADNMTQLETLQTHPCL